MINQPFQNGNGGRAIDRERRHNFRNRLVKYLGRTGIMQVKGGARDVGLMA